MGRCGGLRARRLCSQLAWGILASWMLWALNLQISTRSDRPKTPAILGLMRLNFLSVDYIAGFPDHPHRGFETVTYMIAGRMLHRDSAGSEGLLQNGGVQWMTAGQGVIHSEIP